MDKTIEMAREAGFHYPVPADGYMGLAYDHREGKETGGSLKAFEALVRADEREACAKVCDDFERAKWESVKNISENGGRLAFAGPMHCAKAIRERSNTQ